MTTGLIENLEATPTRGFFSKFDGADVAKKLKQFAKSANCSSESRMSPWGVALAHKTITLPGVTLFMNCPLGTFTEAVITRHLDCLHLELCAPRLHTAMILMMMLLDYIRRQFDARTMESLKRRPPTQSLILQDSLGFSYFIQCPGSYFGVSQCSNINLSTFPPSPRSSFPFICSWQISS